MIYCLAVIILTVWEAVGQPNKLGASIAESEPICALGGSQ